ncbi:PD-(D/E)XK nuclease-like domain-containing protein [Photobacterium frigidiphilum]|uniref:hypothetical protein n=1 Tax=Photobacterium frigidiphilum TaxID=264736 RepID=UPI003D13CA04
MSKVFSAKYTVKKGSFAKNSNLAEEITVYCKCKFQKEVKDLAAVEFSFWLDDDISHYMGPKVGSSNDGQLTSYLSKKELHGQASINEVPQQESVQVKESCQLVKSAICSHPNYFSVCDPNDVDYFVNTSMALIKTMSEKYSVNYSPKKLSEYIKEMDDLMPLLSAVRIYPILESCISYGDDDEGQVEKSEIQSATDQAATTPTQPITITGQANVTSEYLSLVDKNEQPHDQVEMSYLGLVQDTLWRLDENYLKTISMEMREEMAEKLEAVFYEHIDHTTNFDLDKTKREFLAIDWDDANSAAKNMLNLRCLRITVRDVLVITEPGTNASKVLSNGNTNNGSNPTNGSRLESIVSADNSTDLDNVPENEVAQPDNTFYYLEVVKGHVCWVGILPISKQGTNGHFFNISYGYSVNGEISFHVGEFAYQKVSTALMNAWGLIIDLIIQFKNDNPASKVDCDKIIKAIGDSREGSPKRSALAVKFEEIENRIEEYAIEFGVEFDEQEDKKNRSLIDEFNQTESGQRLNALMAEINENKPDISHIDIAVTPELTPPSEAAKQRLAECQNDENYTIKPAPKDVTDTLGQPDKSASIEVQKQEIEDLKGNTLPSDDVKSLPAEENTYSTDEFFKHQVDSLNEKLRTLNPDDLLELDGLPNEVYHAVIGYSSSNIKDELISSQWRHGLEVGEIESTRGSHFDFGNYVHTLLLQPELVALEYTIRDENPKDCFYGLRDMKAAIEEYNEKSDSAASTSELKEMIEEYNKEIEPTAGADTLKEMIAAHNETLPKKLSMAGSAEELAFMYSAMPAEFLNMPNDEKQTAAAYKRYIKAYNDSLPTPLKTAGKYEELLFSIKSFNPEFVAAEQAKKPTLPVNGTIDELRERIKSFAPDFIAAELLKKPTLPVSGTIDDLTQRVKSFNPSAVFDHEIESEWQERIKGGLIGLTQEQKAHGIRLQKAALANPTTTNWFKFQSDITACERSYFWIDEETGLLLKARLDKEIGSTIVDLKTIEVRRDIKQKDIKRYLDDEILKRGYHISAAHYLDGTRKNNFFWIFVNKVKGYEWVAIIQATVDVLDLGRFELRDGISSIFISTEFEHYPGPIEHPVNDKGVPQPLQATLSNFAQRKLDKYREIL